MTKRQTRSGPREARIRDKGERGPGSSAPPALSSHLASDDRRTWLLSLLAGALAFVVFLPTLDNNFVDWDDTGMLTENQSYRGLGAEQLGWMFTTNHYGHYQPITWLTYGLDYVVWGMNPRGYHLTNNLFHAANAVLVFFLALVLLRRAFGARARPPGSWWLRGGALLASLVFAVHPLRVESVAWATERRDLVSAFFLLLTLLAYVRGVSLEGGRRWWWLGVSLVIYVVSMMSKVGGAPLPVVLVVLDWYPLRRIGGGVRAWLSAGGLRVLAEKVPFLVVAIGFSIATFAQQTGKWLFPLEEHGLGARVAQSFYGLVFYVGKTVVPVDLLPLYELHTPLDPFEARFVIAAGLVVLAAAVVLWLLWRRVPAAAPLAAAGLCYALMLGPLLGFFQNGPQIVADRYSYLSCVGWGMVVAGGAVWLLARDEVTTAMRAGVGVLAVLLVTMLGVLTWRQCDVWQDTASLWGYVVTKDPESSFANNGHGYVLLVGGRTAESVEHFQAALRINSRNREAYYNLWRALRGLGRDEELRQAYQQAADAPRPGIRAEALFRLGNIALQARSNQEAVGWYQQSLAIREAHPRAHIELGVVLVRLGRYDEALGHYRRGLALSPQSVKARIGLAGLFEKVGRYDDAIAQLNEVLRIEPNNSQALAWRPRLEAKRSQHP